MNNSVRVESECLFSNNIIIFFSYIASLTQTKQVKFIQNFSNILACHDFSFNAYFGFFLPSSSSSFSYFFAID